MRYLGISILVILAAGVTPLTLWAQNRTVTGIVTDAKGEPLTGAAVSVKGAAVAVLTAFDGRYSIEAPAGATLVFSFIGYLSQEEPVDDRAAINVALREDRQMLDEVVVVGYGTQRKASLTGAVSGVKGEEMRQTKNENPQNMITGRIAGVRVWQKSAEPGAYNNNFDIRGMGSPLVIIDGIPRSMDDFQRINPNDIEDISVLKDATAAIYGVRSGNGVVLVTTRRGSTDGKAKVRYNGAFTLQQPSGMPELADVYETIAIYNEKSMNNISGGSIVYDDDFAESYRNGTRRTTDWNEEVFASVAPQTQHDLSITGGTDKVQYYVGMGYFSQDGFFKSGDLNYNKFNVRSNISAKLLEGLTLDLNLSGVADQQNNPYSRTIDIIRSYWRQGVLFPAYVDPENTMLNYEGIELQENAVAMMTSDVSGYRKYNKKIFQSSAALNYDIGTLVDVLKGLSAKVMFSYDYRLENNSTYRKEYYQYAVNTVTQAYEPALFNASSPSRMYREMRDKEQTLGQFLLNYDRTFGGKHRVTGLLGWEFQKTSTDNFYAQRNLAFSSDRLSAGTEEDQVGSMYPTLNDYYTLTYAALLGRVHYAFDDRYLVEAQFRYDGGSKFVETKRWGFFPSFSAGWRISEEPLFKATEALSFIDQLKLRVNYGESGHDGDLEYDWITGYVYPDDNSNQASGYYNQHVPGYIFDLYTLGVKTTPLPNRESTWYAIRTLDIGIDFEAWNGLFGFSIDYFNRLREGRFARRTGDLPTVVGATAPRENLNSDRQFGIDLELSHRHNIGDFQYRVKGIATITRQKYLTAVQNGPYANSYRKWRDDNLNNRYQGVQFGYEGNGRFTDWNDIRTYDLYHERGVLPGDYKYIDWNGDGEINGLDEHPIAFDQTPWLNFSLNLEASWKNFDAAILLQGSALGSMQYQEPLYNIWGSNGGGVLTQYLDRWHPADPLADPYDPATEWIEGYYGYTGHYPTANSTFNRVSTAYLRLKSVELGYTLPRIKALSAMNLRVFVNAYNLLTITGVKFVDPEHPEDELSRLYPLNKTYTVGLSLSF
ncbi:MAG: TonB-dependent receptor [Prevotellaceae bacterium]|jgi:TonB-linked SusC/RagA family outer membrane protein|nr:TonB-dependent receptor [Prevotellaceae bacterium]